MMKRVFIVSGFYVILFSLFCLVTHAQSTNPGQRVGKGPGQVIAVEGVRGRFGSGPDDIGVSTPEEANPEGPMSFALGSGGEIYILDQVNSRIQVFKNNKRTKTIPIPCKTVCDIDLIPDNKIVLLDNCVKKSIFVLDTKGNLLNTIPLKGQNIPYPGGVSEIRIREDEKWPGIWVKTEGRLVRIVRLDGTPDPDRISVPGLLSVDGRRLMRAEKIGDATAAIYLSKRDSAALWDAPITYFFNMQIVHLLGLWDDREGRIYLGATVEDKPEIPISNIVVVLNPEGKEIGRVKLFVQQMPHEINRSIRISPDGHIFQMALDKRGVFVRRYDFVY